MTCPSPFFVYIYYQYFNLTVTDRGNLSVYIQAPLYTQSELEGAELRFRMHSSPPRVLQFGGGRGGLFCYIMYSRIRNGCRTYMRGSLE